MEDNKQFVADLQAALTQKQVWYNKTELPKLLDQYRLLHTCVKNLYESLTKKNLIVPDPYRLDRKISDIVTPETTPFGENETAAKIGTRFSEYETMLDFICTYFSFNVESITLAKIKKLEEFNNCFKWADFSLNSVHPNTRGLANILNDAKKNAEQITVSLINDNVDKCAQALDNANKALVKLAKFEMELYKGTLRRDLFEHPNFNHEKAGQSPENEFNEIKRIYPEVLGKKPFYKELIMEIVNEDQGPDCQKLRAELLQKLKIQEAVKVKKVKKDDPRELLIASLNVIGAFAPIYLNIYQKTSANFQLLNKEKKGFMNSLKKALMKLFNIQPKDLEITVAATDPATKERTTKRIKAYDFMEDLQKKTRIYNAIANKGPEYNKIISSNDQAILAFIGKQISENQNLFNTLNALDEHFKSSVDPSDKAKVRGIKIELDSLKLTIINCNKKRGEYISVVEEETQMKKLGLSDDD